MKGRNKILIVDDDPENLELLETLLHSFEVTFIRAYSGEEALMKTLDHNFALALIDANLPEMDGYDTVKLLRGVDHTKYLPVIFISDGYSEEHFLIEGIEAGAVDFLTRPVIPRVIAGKVKVFLELHEQKQKLVKEIEQRRKSEQNLLSKERELKEAIKKAELADKLKSAFLANISHEIRTPMNSIIGFSNLLKGPDVNFEDRIKYIHYINNSGEILLNLINDVIDFAKIEADQIKVHKENVNVDEVLREMVDTYSEELYRKNKKDVRFLLNFTDGQENTTIYTDSFRFRQILSNLIMNAIKFTSEGFIQISYSLDSEQINICICDTGIGIPKDKLKIIFDRFVQLESNTLTNSTGTGLGLAISKRLAEILGGTIHVESIEGKGSTFCLCLPVYTKFPKQATLDNKMKVLRDFSAWEGKKILIAEDEEINFYFLKEALRKYNLDIIWAHDGQEAIDIFNNNQEIDLVLMDVKMPKVNGYQAMEYIKKISSVPVIAQTAYAMSGEKEQMMHAGFDFCLTKPININLLLSTIDRFLVQTVKST